MGRRIHILGASGSGTSTLARTLASRLGTQCFDTDDFYWTPTDPPFRDKRPVPDRLRLMQEVFLPRPDWILAGPFHSWGAAAVAPRLTHVIHLTLDREERLRRLKRREARRWGARIAPGGDLEALHRGFLDWAAGYDDPTFTGRSRAQQEAWLATLALPVIRLDAAVPQDRLAEAALAALDGAAGAA